MINPKQTILGEVPAKSNSYRIITIKGKGGAPGHSSLAKTAECKAYEKAFSLQCLQYRNKAITGWFEFHVNIYYKDNRKDLDGSFKILLDCLQMESVNAIKNDRYCKKIIAEKHFDEKNPRIEFVIIPLAPSLF